MNLFESVYERFAFDRHKTVNVVETFAGIGSQAMALKRLGRDYNLKFNFLAMSEIDKYAIQSYNAIHGETPNLGPIGGFERFPKGIDLCSWSFPCQDISLAGKQKGLEEGTRSNYGFVFLDTVENTPHDERPKVLLMENVDALVSVKFKKDYAEIHERLERMGYTSWGGLMNAKDYGVAQTRERIFVLSILGEYTYTYPKAFPLTKKLSDYLEPVVDEKYFLSDKMIAYLTDMKDRNGFVRGERFKPRFEDSEYAFTITTNAGQRATDNFIIIPEATKKGYTEAEEGDGVYLNRPHQKRGVVQKGMIQTLKTQPGDVGVVVKDTRTKKERLVDDLIEQNIVKEGDVVNHSYTSSKQRTELKDFIESENGIMPTLHTRLDIFGVVVGTYQHSKSDNFMKGKDWFQPGKEIADTIVTNTKEGVVLENEDGALRIRKLTPRETWRLMGIDDADFDKAKAAGLSDAQLYKQAGNSIVVDVLYYIFKNLFNLETEDEK